jgi:hypothetical protein
MVGFASSKGRHLSDSVVNSHEVGVLHELGDEFSHAHPLTLTCYRGDGHEALFRSSVHLAFNLVKCFREVLYGKAFTETSTSFVPLHVAPTSGVLIVAGLICGCIGRQLVCCDIFEVAVKACP